MSSLTVPQVDLGNTFGAALIGAVLAAVLFGVSNVQAFVYFQTHRDTGITFFKLVVIGLWVLDALHLAFVVHSVYFYLVTNYANFAALTVVVWSGKLQIAFNMFTVWIVHFMYAYRIWIVSTGRSRTLPIAVGTIVSLGLGIAIAVTYEVYKSHSFADLAGIEWSTLLYLSTVTFIDFVIASSLCYLLATARTGFSSTDSFLTKLMVYTINTGCLTSLCSMTALITCAVMPNNLIYVGVEFLVTKLYVNSFLALMNARYYLQPNDTEPVALSEFRAHRPTLHSTTSGSGVEDLPTSRINHMFKHPHDEELQAVKPRRPITVTMEMASLAL